MNERFVRKYNGRADAFVILDHASEHHVESAQKNILYVEDNVDDAFLFRELFEQAGVTNPFCIAHDGQMAIEYLAGEGAFADRDKYPLPCLALLDMQLPQKDGLEVLEWIRQQPELKRLVVILFASAARQEDINRAYDLGANSFIIKPVEYQENASLVVLLKEFWLGANQFGEIRKGR